MHLQRAYRACALVFGLALVSCGGGGTKSAASPNAPSTAAAAATTNVPLTLTVHLPVNGATVSAVFRLTTVVPPAGIVYTGAVDTDTLVSTTSGSPNCVVVASSEACSTTTLAPAPAVNVYTIYTFAVAAPIVGTTVPLTVYAGYALPVAVAATNVAVVAIGGVPAALAFSPSSIGNVAPAASATLTTSVQVQDASGATIISGANFTAPDATASNVVFTGCDPHLNPLPLTFSAANPSELGADTLTLTYDGLAAATSTLHCSANGPGALNAQFTLTFGSAGAPIYWNVEAARRR